MDRRDRAFDRNMQRAVLVAVVCAVTPALADPCIPKNEPDWTCPEIGLAADGDKAIVCLRETCGNSGEIGCVTIDPKTGTVSGAGTWPERKPVHEAALPGQFELTLEDRTIAVCHAGTCTRLTDALPVDTVDRSQAIVNPSGTQVFVLRGDGTADTYDLKKHKRVKHMKTEFEGGPPPPTSAADLVYYGRGILVGDFGDPGIMERAIDPVTGHMLLLDKPWVRLPGNLLASFEAFGLAQLLDFDDHLATVAKRKAGRPHQPTEGAIGDIVAVGSNAVIVTQDPPATLFVDSKARTISKPRALPLCR